MLDISKFDGKKVKVNYDGETFEGELVADNELAFWLIVAEGKALYFNEDEVKKCKICRKN